MSETKKCPYCAEEINMEAVKCKYCGEFLDKKTNLKEEILEASPTDQNKTSTHGDGIFNALLIISILGIISLASSNLGIGGIIGGTIVGAILGGLSALILKITSNKVIRLISLITLTLFVGIIIVIGGSLIKSNMDFDDNALAQAAVEANKSLPIMVDDITRLDSIQSLPGKVFQYNYTLINIEKSDLFPVEILELKNTMTPGLINIVKTTGELATFRNSNVTFNYSYRDINGLIIFEIKILPYQYKL